MLSAVLAELHEIVTVTRQHHAECLATLEMVDVLQSRLQAVLAAGSSLLTAVLRPSLGSSNSRQTPDLPDTDHVRPARPKGDPRPFYLHPKQQADGSWVWTELQVFLDPNKGEGVRARVDLPPNTRLFYYGRDLDPSQWELLKEDADDKNGLLKYVISGHNGYVTDGHPRWESMHVDEGTVGGKGLYMAAKINEPSTGKTANLVMSMDMDPLGQRRRCYVAPRGIAAGQELTVSYGSDYNRSYRPGRRVTRLPKFLKRPPPAPTTDDTKSETISVLGDKSPEHVDSSHPVADDDIGSQPTAPRNKNKRRRIVSPERDPSLEHVLGWSASPAKKATIRQRGETPQSASQPEETPTALRSRRSDDQDTIQLANWYMEPYEDGIDEVDRCAHHCPNRRCTE